MTGERAAYAASFNFTQADAVVSQRLMGYWINFAYHSDPNGPGLPTWSAYTTQKNILRLNVNEAEVVVDSFPEQQIAFLWNHAEILQY
ncbi:hypothetical protein DB88DRAFT_507629 [Papiliotrema laurentii]|uniref:Carboxylesterase type B domain-containing protein n=1 Tax=Papiliotrema laurentii TaxID=5418 RepID=A0AAD9FWR6_PAPLA|nr:hypothetical protein DB88DRAFT_507629 [Papiliotrema laurentii]